MTTRNPIVFDHVWKRYQIGANHDSLRDAIPALLKRWTGREERAAADGAFWAVKDVSFEVRAGENLGIIGPNGAGKSTILKLLSKITTQTKGALTLRGRLAALIELGGGFHLDLSGRENIYLQGTMLGLSHRRVRKLFDSIVEFSELEAFLDTPVKRYSSGMVVRLGFAIAAHVQPEVLLLDEVLAVGDLAFQQKCFKRIAELKALGVTMVFISHNLEAVQKLCDRVLLLQHGQVIGDGDPVQTIHRYREEVLADTRNATASALETGGGDVVIQRVALRNDDGVELETVETGGPLRVEIAFQAKRPIHDPMVRVTIDRLDGLMCHSTSSRQQGLTPEVLSGEGLITLQYPAVNLLPNFYQLVVEIFEGRNPIPVASLSQGRFFQMTSESREQGAVHLEHHWLLALRECRHV